MSDFEDAIRRFIGTPPEGYEWQLWCPPQYGGSAYVSSGDRTCMFKAVPLWVPPAGLKKGWVTNDRIGAYWWSRRPDYDGEEHIWDHGTNAGVRVWTGLLICEPPITGCKAIWEIK